MINWSERGHVLATHDEEVIYCRIVGVGNMNNCAPFRTYSIDMQGHGYRHFVLDFSACTSLDSTFLGILVGLAVGEGGARPDVVVINANSNVVRTLREVGIDRLLKICRGRLEFPEIPLERLEPGPKASRPLDRARMILEAHEALCEVEPSNQARFGSFIDHLKRELSAQDDPST